MSTRGLRRSTRWPRDWVVYIEPPPRIDSGPEHVLRYLARYMTGGPISDGRMIDWREDRITFAARSSDKTGRQVPVTLTGCEFVRRWTLHILPKGFVKSRCFGGWSNAHRQAYRAMCDALGSGIDRDEPFALETSRCPWRHGKNQRHPRVVVLDASSRWS